MNGRHRRPWFDQPRSWHIVIYFVAGLCVTYGSAIVVSR